VEPASASAAASVATGLSAASDSATAAAAVAARQLPRAGATPPAAPPPRGAAPLFLVAAIGAIGLPPLSGFVGKAMVLAATPLPHAFVLWPLVLVAGLVLIVALSRTGTRLLWAIPASYGYEPPSAEERASQPAVRAKLAACALLLACVIAITLGAGPLKNYLDDTAAQLSDRGAYVDAVLHGTR
jgi:multicomponent K+:H+ antiporter subunit D